MRINYKHAFYVLGLTLLVNQNAIAGDWFVGGSVGVATGNEDSSSVNQQLNGAINDASVDSPDNSRFAWQIYGAYQHESNFGVELAYVDLGEVEAEFVSNTASIDDLINNAESIHPETAQGLRLLGTYKHTLSNLFQLQIKAGLFNWNTDYTLSSGTISEKVSRDDVDYTVGLTLDYAFDKKISGQVLWDYYTIDDETINMFSVGVVYQF